MNQITQTRKSFYQKYTDIMPRGAGALFFIQIFSTLSFSILYSTLVLYATKGLNINDKTATAITTAFIAFNYALHLLGGYIGGRFMSNRSLFLVGMTIQIVGCTLIANPTVNTLLWGLATFLTGAGLNVTCINCMMTQLFRPEDKRREAAFLWNYSGMNIGFLTGFSISGWLQLQSSYHTLFLLAAFGNFIALILTLIHWKKLNDSQTILTKIPQNEQKKRYLIGVIFLALLIPSLRFFLSNSEASNKLIMLGGIIMLAIIAFIATQQTSSSKAKKIWGYLILSGASLAFWTLYQMAPMGLMLFIERNVNRNIFGVLIAPQWIQNINTIVIITGGPILSVIFTTLRYRGISLTIPFQFGIALLCIGTALAILPIGIQFADLAGYVGLGWIFTSYVLQSIGELFISPIGYAMVGQLAPSHLQGIMMGTWMMMTGLAATLSGHFSKLALGNNVSTDPLVTNPGFSHIFSQLGWSAIGIGITVLALTPLIIKLTQEKKNDAKVEIQTNKLAIDRATN